MALLYALWIFQLITSISQASERFRTGSLGILSSKQEEMEASSESPAVLSGELNPSTFKNVVIIPDIHGDRDSFLRSLWMSLEDVEAQRISFDAFVAHVESYLALAAGRGAALSNDATGTVLIQLGDVVDRGPYGLECLRILDVIEEAIGWKTVRLYGNHEILSHAGKAGIYIHREEVRFFEAEFGSPNARVTEFAKGGSLWKQVSGSSLLMARIRTGASAPSVDSASTLFVHGGIDLNWVAQAEANSGRLYDESLVDMLNRYSSALLDEGAGDIEIFERRMSPLWTRDAAEGNQHYICSKLLPRILSKFNVARMVVGHTPQIDRRMKSLCMSRLILADAAMSRWMVSDPDSGRGNPTALIMKQSDGLLHSLEALYLDSTTQLVGRSVFYRSDVGPQEFRPTYLHRRPDLVERTGPGQVRGLLIPIRFQFEGMSQTMTGSERHDFIYTLRSMNPVHAVGVPFIVYQSPMESSESEFFVIYDVHGPSLRECLDLTIDLRRQILEIILDLWNSGYVLNHAQSLVSKSVLDMFIIDSATRLVKFVDFARLTARSGGSSHVQLKNALTPVINDLNLVSSEDGTERIDHPVLVEEIFGSLVGLEGLLYHDDLGSVSSVEGDMWDVEEGAFANLGAFLAPVVDNSLPLPFLEAWGVASFDLISRSGASSLFAAQIGSHSPLGFESGIIVEVAASKRDTLSFLLSLTSAASGVHGIPRLGAVEIQPDGGFMVIWDLDFKKLIPTGTPIHDIPNVEPLNVRDSIIDVVSFLHANFFSLGPKDESNTILRVEADTSKVWLVDVSSLRLESDKPPEFFDQELQEVKRVLDVVFTQLSTPHPAFAV